MTIAVLRLTFHIRRVNREADCYVFSIHFSSVFSRAVRLATRFSLVRATCHQGSDSFSGTTFDSNPINGGSSRVTTSQTMS